MKTNKLSVQQAIDIIQQAIDIIQQGTGLNKTEIKNLPIEEFTFLFDLVREHNRISLEIERKVFSIQHK